MDSTLKTTARKAEWKDQRGAALITMLFISVLILAAGGTLILTTSMSATNSIDASSEIQAYYAAEAGNQAVLEVLRGNVAPSTTQTENKIDFRKAVTISSSNTSTDTTAAHLSRWMPYITTYNPARVALSTGYNPMNGLAFSATLTDPDNTATVSFSTSGAFDNSFTSKSFGSGQTKATLAYTAQPVTTIDTFGASTLGKFTISSVGNNGYTFSNEPFTLTITQTLPFAATYNIACTLSGTVTDSSSTVVTVNFPTISNSLQGVVFTRTSTAINSNGSTWIPVTVKAPAPSRLIVNTTGYGPRNAQKQMKMLLSRFAFDMVAPSAITIRSADDNTQLTFNAGNSARYIYNGNDNAGGVNVSAFAVTGSTDKAYLDSLSLPGGQVFGTPSGVQKVDISALPSWLQTADAARAFVSEKRKTAQNEGRYFTTASPPASSDFGTITTPVLTFVDGDVDVPPAGGAGLLIVTGTLTMNGSCDYKGVILVLGGGQLVRDGGGNGTTLGALLVGRFGSSGNFLPPTFNSNGTGTSTIEYDSEWVRRGLSTTGPRVMAIGEF